jgi:hypothetical protein
MSKLINVLPTTSFDYSSLAANATSEVTHGPLINTVQAKELIVIPRVSARVSGTGVILVIVRAILPAEDDAGELPAGDLVTLTISGGAPPLGFVGRVSGGLPEWVRVLTSFTQPGTAGALLCRHGITVVLNDA